MPRIILQAANNEIAKLLVKYALQIERTLRIASSTVLQHEAMYSPEEFVVDIPPALLYTSENAALLVIYTFASDREIIRGKETQWRNQIVVDWVHMMIDPYFKELREALPNDKVDVWPQIAPGAKWGTVKTVIDQLLVSGYFDRAQE